jgi:ubiquinone/menaquinone biosynthesis C-methylase UbiE
MPCPRSAYIDGWFYAMVFDRMLAPVHRFVAKLLTGSEEVIDLCCGTGSLAFRMAGQCRRVVGVDLSPRMVRYARRALVERGVPNLQFELGDAAHLPGIADRAYDMATLVLGLHEMPRAARAGVLAEALRVGRQALVIDYAAPMPWSWTKVISLASEVACGPRHLSSFRDFERHRGLEPLLEEAGATIVRRGRLNSGCMEIVTATAR